eukprot:scaffold2809_cov373-Prasinococcus_capsulatus_cf.AAC.13
MPLPSLDAAVFGCNAHHLRRRSYKSRHADRNAPRINTGLGIQNYLINIPPVTMVFVPVNLTPLVELRIHFRIFDDHQGVPPAHGKPLASLPPVPFLYHWSHARVISALDIVKRIDERHWGRKKMLPDTVKRAEWNA